jgi:hypothetical protein
MPRKPSNRTLTAALSLLCVAARVGAQTVTRAPIEPAAQAIFERYIRATQPSQAPKYSHLVTEMQSGGSPVIRGERFTMLPDRILSRTTMPGLGTTEAGFDGKIGWTVTPMTGPVLLDGEPLSQLKAQGPSLLAIEQFVRLALVGRDSIDDRAVNAVLATSANGDSATYYFDATSGLLAAMRTHRANGKPIDGATTIVFADYQRLEGRMFATKLSMRLPGHELVIRTVHLDHDPFDSAKFAPPSVLLGVKGRP